ncbi:MAG TPA: LPS export ABC transporter periplasmic protein LptC [Firmicutes bacterium]|nr:LPS export ABC transporter periplasmic protein LptC [Bacillota bacterium]
MVPENRVLSGQELTHGGTKVKFGSKTPKIVVRSLLFLVGLVVLVFVYRSLQPQEETTPLVLSEEKGLTLLNASYEGWDEAKRSWLLEAAQIFQTKDGKNSTFQGVKKIQFFQKDQRSLSLKADEATLDLKKNLLMLTNVQGYMTEGEFTTEEMSINTKTKKITSSKRISFSKEGLKVEADQMEGDFETEEYIFCGNLHVQQKNNRSRGETFRYYAQEDRFEIQGGVEVELEL